MIVRLIMKYCNRNINISYADRANEYSRDHSQQEWTGQDVSTWKGEAGIFNRKGFVYCGNFVFPFFSPPFLKANHASNIRIEPFCIYVYSITE